jgi:hypothetical protein
MVLLFSLFHVSLAPDFRPACTWALFYLSLMFLDSCSLSYRCPDYCYLFYNNLKSYLACSPFRNLQKLPFSVQICKGAPSLCPWTLLHCPINMSVPGLLLSFVQVHRLLLNGINVPGLVPFLCGASTPFLSCSAFLSCPIFNCACTRSPGPCTAFSWTPILSVSLCKTSSSFSFFITTV